jgi:hypothetical protein
LREHIKHKIFEIHIFANNIPENSEMFQRWRFKRYRCTC